MRYFDEMNAAKFSRLKERYERDGELKKAEILECSVKQCIKLDNIRRSKIANSFVQVNQAKIGARDDRGSVSNERLQAAADRMMKFGGSAR